LDIYTQAGKRLKDLRKQAGLTQEDLAEKAGITPAFLSYLENGRKKGSLDTYAKLAAGLGVELGQVFVEPGTKEKRYPEIPLNLGLSVAEAKAVRQLVKTLRKGGRT
jgi:transcriptional regulator with XRE-family HTH domain